MKLGMYALRDIKVGFMNPWLSHNDATALRSYKGALDKVANPEDTELWKVGTFNDEHGGIKADKKCIITYSQILKGDDENVQE